MLSIKYTKSAKKDLEDIYLYILQDSKQYADRFINDIEQHISLLINNPYLGKECRYKNIFADCRVLFYKYYLILYKINKDYNNS